MLTFETELGRKKIQRSDGKYVTTCFVRYLFGSLLCLSYKKIDMAEVLLYPLPPDPLLLSYSDGSMLSSSKSHLINLLSASSREFTKHV